MPRSDADLERRPPTGELFIRHDREHIMINADLGHYQSEFVAHDDNETMGFNTSGMLGFGMATTLSNAWAPRVSFAGTMTRFGVKLGTSAVLNMVREFGPDREEQLQ